LPARRSTDLFGLLVVQVALSTILVAGSLLFAITLAGLAAQRLGFRADGVLALAVQGKSPDLKLEREYFDELLRRLRALPGVERVSIANQLPMEFPVDYCESGEVSVSSENWVTAEAHCAFPEYFASLGAPVLQGREFGGQEGRAIVISQLLSWRLFGTESSIGRTLREKRDGKTTDREVVGVVTDIEVRFASRADRACVLSSLSAGVDAGAGRDWLMSISGTGRWRQTQSAPSGTKSMLWESSWFSKQRPYETW